MSGFLKSIPMGTQKTEIYTTANDDGQSGRPEISKYLIPRRFPQFLIRERDLKAWDGSTIGH